ncbi:replicative DNA helicase [Acetobacter syzygii]|uniref:replicative DNA helicase n=1 Tax=Acetobacter syzygii TaxID=146476 RepID=UPI00156D98AA|nr:DnaB-like helicase C-terminal domain-containing protein [Acetobacter syzygii]NSL92930.1 helicase [Acetobacter syzygii]
MADGGIFGEAMRQPPVNLEAEQNLLSAILFNNKVFFKVDEIVEPQHFANALHGRVYELCRKVINAGRQADPITLQPMLDGDVLLGRLSANEFLLTIATLLGSAVMGEDYAYAIRDAWIRRCLFKACSNILDRCCRPGAESGPEIVDALETDLLELARGTDEALPTYSLEHSMQQARIAAEEAARRGNGLAGITWGYRALDRMTGGLMPSAMYLLGARPAMGKTSLGFGIATRSAAAGHSVLFWSGEMTAPQLGARAGAAWANLSTQSVFTGRRYDIPEDMETGEREPLSDWQWRDLEEGERKASALALQIDTQPRVTVAKLRSRARRMKRSKRGLDLIVVDYVGLMSAGSVYEDQRTYERITKVSGQLKQLATELEVPIVVLAQLNRESERREDKRPMMSDLRDAGALEQDADVILLLHREHYYLKKQLDSGLVRKDKESSEDYANRCSEFAQRVIAAEGKADVLIPKNRQGPEGTCHLRFTNRTTWFRDVSEDELSPAWVVKKQEAGG